LNVTSIYIWHGNTFVRIGFGGGLIVSGLMWLKLKKELFKLLDQLFLYCIPTFEDVAFYFSTYCRCMLTHIAIVKQLIVSTRSFIRILYL